MRLAEIVDERELSDQLDHARTLRLAKNEMIWLAGNTFYGAKQIFEPEFMEWLADFRLPEYELTRRDGQYELRFEGPWTQTTMWEIPGARHHQRTALARGDAMHEPVRPRRALCPRQGQAVEQGRTPARARGAKARCASPISARAAATAFCGSDGASRRCRKGSARSFIGTSNVKHAMDTGLEAIGTNAHELPMVYAALADNDEALRDAPYEVLRDWARMYGGNLLVVLPDCFGTTAFLEQAPDWVADWKGARPDSRRPSPAARELIAWWKRAGAIRATS